MVLSYLCCLCLSESNEIMCNPANELSLRKRPWRKKRRATETRGKGLRERKSCDGKKQRNVPPELLLLISCVCVCVVVFHADLKPLLLGAYVKDHRPPDVMPPGSLHSSPRLSWPHSLLIDFLNPLWPPSVSALHQLAPSLHSYRASSSWVHLYLSFLTLFSAHISSPHLSLHFLPTPEHEQED